MSEKKELDRFYSHSPVVCLFRGRMKPWGDVTGRTGPVLLYRRPWAEGARIPCFEGALHLGETCRAKIVFAIVNGPVAKAYLCEKRNWAVSGTLIQMKMQS